MKKIEIKKIYGLIALGAFLWFLPSVGLGQCNVSIGTTSYTSINAAVNAAGPFTTINVSGTCNEIVQIPANKNSVTLNGGGTATISCQSPPFPQGFCATQINVLILGKAISITGFNITGGVTGIQLIGGSNATINGNTIYGTDRSGISVAQDSFAHILNNTIHDAGINPSLPGRFPQRGGIIVNDNSSAYIGVRSPSDTVASPNIIRNNFNGIILGRSSSARIVGNTISNNTEDGIVVSQVSQADIADNLIDGNGENGIFVTQSSGVNLGNDKGTTIFDLPNSGTNGNKGLSCSIGGYVDGVLGTLYGTHGALGFNLSCLYSITK
jgi:parallel beta-helix repeat protein